MLPEYRNPFEEVGIIVKDSGFIGRGQELQRAKTFRNYGNLAVIGGYSIGKSSLVYHAFCNPSQLKDLQDLGVLAVIIDLSEFEDPESFFRDILKEFLRQLKKTEIPNDILLILKDIIDNACQPNILWEELRGWVKDFFETTKDSGYRMKLIVDEFDSATSVFKHKRICLQTLRSLSDNYNTTFVVISRRTLRRIEDSIPGLSTFHQLFTEIFLSVFNTNELELYFQHLEQFLGNSNYSKKRHLSDQDRGLIINYCGGHPFLLTKLGNQIAYDLFYYNILDIRKSFLQVAREFKDFYERILTFLDEGEELEKLFQVLFGPRLTTSMLDARILASYGLIRLDENERYTAFSNHFQRYLWYKERNIEPDSLFKVVEKELRLLIDHVLQEHYKTQDWIQKLIEERHPLANEVLNLALENLNQDDLLLADTTVSPLDYTGFMGLFAIISCHYLLFKDVFPSDSSGFKQYWDPRFEAICKIRNAMAHNQSLEILHAKEVNQAKIYLQNLQELINHYFQTK